MENNENNNIENNNLNIEKMEYGSSPFGSTAIGSSASDAPRTCPVSLKYSGDTITLQATPKDGVSPYYVVFRKNGTDIDPLRLGGSNPIPSAPGDVTITKTYTLDNADILGAITGTIDFSVYMTDSCPTGGLSCTEHCVINIGCIAPVCNFTVT